MYSHLPSKTAEKLNVLTDLIRKEWAEEERKVKEEGCFLDEEDFDMQKMIHQSRD